ncbi:MAG: HupE/UreJ family protein [Phycisphaerales bacterium]|nr:HupE/UreJ family protein [Phycisphaerales bacterium]
MRARLLAVRCLLLAALMLLAHTAAAAVHPALGTVATIKITPGPDGATVELIVTHDALAYALNDTSVRITDPQMYALLDGPREDLASALQDGRERFQSGFKLLADGQPLELELIQSPSLELIDQWKLDNPTERLPCKLEFIAQAKLPQGAATIAIRAPAVFDQVILGVTRPGFETTFMPLEPAETSPEFDVSALTGPTPTPASDGGDAAPTPPPATTHPTRPSGPGVLSVAWRYIELGYRHIIPNGADHELFILGLFLLNSRLKDLLWQTMTFTLAHTCTVTLATFGLVHVSPALINPVVALTIAFVAIENLFTTKVHPWRAGVAFLFGLIHGIGFAAGLLSIGLPPSQLVTAIIAFNVGVEGGHLTILAIAFAVLGWWRHESWYRARVSIPLSVAIAVIALYWFVQRVV